jgi:hypothetical protein
VSLQVWDIDDLGLKIWNMLDVPKFGCTTVLPKSIKEYLKIEDGIVLKNENLIVNLFEEN